MAPLLIGNWKMNGTLLETRKLLFQLATEWRASCERVDVVVCPPFTSLLIARQELEDSTIALGAQNCYLGENGAFTGEISAAMLADIGCEYVILGHSERRVLFGDTNDVVAQKLRAALDAGLRPILCVGESRAERAAGETTTVLAEQLRGSLSLVRPSDVPALTIAYEPVWAIGTGKTASPTQANEAHAFLRTQLVERFGIGAESIRILYGGSVKPSNARELFQQRHIDGGLIGGAALEAPAFIAIIEAAAASSNETLPV